MEIIYFLKTVILLAAKPCVGTNQNVLRCLMNNLWLIGQMTHRGWVETIRTWSAMGYRRWLRTDFKWILWEHHN